MANVTVPVAFDMLPQFNYFIELDVNQTETDTERRINVPNGSTLVLQTNAVSVTQIQLLDSSDDVIFTATSPVLTLAKLDTDLTTGGVLDMAAMLEWALKGTDTVTGSSGSDYLHGFAGKDTLNGGGGDDGLWGDAGADKLNGGAGADDMYGGGGDDIYIVNDELDNVGENFDEGDDTVKSKLTWVLPQYVENLVLTGTDAVNGTGNDDDNAITGNGAANILNGGAGNDTLAGLAGNDSYEVDSTADTVTEQANGGTDHVLSTAETFTLGANVEKLTLLGSATGGTGNELINVLTGNATLGSTLLGMAGNDTLKGFAGDDVMRGGIGNDKLTGGEGNDELHGDGGTDNMTGGPGNDEYWLDTATDVVTEAVDGGEDTLYATFTVSLASYANVENLILTGTANLNGTGTGDSNDLTGNGGINVLSAGGGSDYMQGKGGNDNLKGGGGDDNMNGGGGDDIINGGAGFDTMAGGTGSDIFVFNTDLASDPNNSVIDFVTVEDKLRLDQTIFTELTVGTLSADSLVIGTSPVAGDADDRFLYDNGTGNLYYDPDGNGSDAAIQFANISGGPTLVAADIIIVA